MFVFVGFLAELVKQGEAVIPNRRLESVAQAHPIVVMKARVFEIRHRSGQLRHAGSGVALLKVEVGAIIKRQDVRVRTRLYVTKIRQRRVACRNETRDIAGCQSGEFLWPVVQQGIVGP